MVLPVKVPSKDLFEKRLKILVNYNIRLVPLAFLLQLSMKCLTILNYSKGILNDI